MGNTFSQIAVWTTLYGKQRLAFVKENEIVLKACLNFVDTLNNVHPWESMVIFAEPLVWVTHLRHTDFPLDEYTITKAKIIPSKPKQSPSTQLLEFQAKLLQNDDLKKGTPLEGESSIRELTSTTTREPTSREHTSKKLQHKLKVWNFNYLKKVMDLAGSNKLIEARACFETLANFDLYKRILGKTTEDKDVNIIQFMEQTIEQERDKADVEFLRALHYRPSWEIKAGQNIYTVRLFFLIMQFDMQFLKQSIKSVVEEVQLSASKVKRDVSTLQIFTGLDQYRSLLKSIRYITEMVSARGARPPIWREFGGDICYLYVEPLDRKAFFAACNTGGYYMIKGYNYINLQMNFQRVGLVHRDLTSLLCSISPKFNENFNKEEMESLLADRTQLNEAADAVDRQTDVISGPSMNITKYLAVRSGLRKKGLAESRRPIFAPTLKWSVLSTKKIMPMPFFKKVAINRLKKQMSKLKVEAINPPTSPPSPKEAIDPLTSPRKEAINPPTSPLSEAINLPTSPAKSAVENFITENEQNASPQSLNSDL